MTTFANGKSVPAEDAVEIDLPVGSSAISAASLSAQARYYFNLTDGNTMIRDEEGIEAASLQAAVLAAMEAVEELRAQDPSNSDEWQGWRLEVIDVSGRVLQTIPLNVLYVLSAHWQKVTALPSGRALLGASGIGKGPGALALEGEEGQALFATSLAMFAECSMRRKCVPMPAAIADRS